MTVQMAEDLMDLTEVNNAKEKNAEQRNINDEEKQRQTEEALSRKAEELEKMKKTIKNLESNNEMLQQVVDNRQNMGAPAESSNNAQTVENMERKGRDKVLEPLGITGSGTAQVANAIQ